MKNRIVLVTGATAGIGKATVFSLAKSGTSLILLGRNEMKAETVSRQIKQKTGNEKVRFYKADFLLMKEIKSVAERIKNDYESINVIINNAGGRFLDHKISEEGIEQTIAVNYLSHFLLTDLLLEKLKSSPSARIINVSSATHYGGKGVIENIASSANYNGKQQYSDSKLATVLFTYNLAEKLRGTNVTVNAMDPGGVATNFARNNGLTNWLKHRIYYLMKRELLTPEQGAETILYLASSSEIEGVTGKYFYKNKEKRSSELSYRRVLQEQLLKFSREWITTSDF